MTCAGTWPGVRHRAKRGQCCSGYTRTPALVRRDAQCDGILIPMQNLKQQAAPDVHCMPLLCLAAEHVSQLGEQRPLLPPCDCG